MIELGFAIPTTARPLHVLCLGAHSDDLEIGCGGTMLTLSEKKTPLHVTWVVLSAHNQRRQEAIKGADLVLEHVERKDIVIKDFRDGFFPYSGGDIKDFFELLKTRVSPDLIFTHYRHDLHQDHRIVSELTWNTFRDHLILEYEIPKYDGDLGSPNTFVRLDNTIAQKKIELILTTFQSQEDRQWFSADLFLSLLRLRGMESASASGYAEAFYGRKLIFNFDSTR